jgi:hypothetical protein
MVKKKTARPDFGKILRRIMLEKDIKGAKELTDSVHDNPIMLGHYILLWTF